MGPERLAVLERWLPNTATILDTVLLYTHFGCCIVYNFLASHVTLVPNQELPDSARSIAINVLCPLLDMLEGELWRGGGGGNMGERVRGGEGRGGEGRTEMEEERRGEGMGESIGRERGREYRKGKGA